MKVPLEGLKKMLRGPWHKLNLPPLRAIKAFLSPRIAVGLIVVVTLMVVVFFQYRIQAVVFKKPGAKKEVAKKEEAPAPPQEPVLVKVYKVQKKDFDDSLPLLGTVKGFKEINLKFETNGVIDSINFKEGEKIETGEIIATLNQKDALLKVKYNQIELEKTQKLFDIGAIAKAKLDQVKLEMESAKREVEKTYLYAPRSGILGTKDAEAGEYITSSDKIGTFIDSKEVFVEVGIVERDIGRVKPGQKGKVTIDTYGDTEFDAVVDNVSPVVEGKSRTQTARLKVKNPKGQLLPGMFARATCAVYSAKGAIVIPNNAVDKTEEGYITFVFKKEEAPPKKEAPKGKDAKKKDKKEKESKKKEEPKEEPAKEAAAEQGIAKAKPIQPDYRAADFFVVKKGLEEGDLVVVETQEKLKDGNKIIVTETQEAGS
ncbi:MAG: efflux RND transporter periplasmic adaptor subunit [Candidatus Omnitrophota bacterium]